MNKKFDEYVKKYSDEIAKDSLEEQMEKYGVTIDMPADEFYPRIFAKVNEMREQEVMNMVIRNGEVHYASPPESEDDSDFKELIYLRFIKKYNKSVEGDWKLNHLPAVHNLEQAILDLPEGHFLTNDMLTLITNKDYKGDLLESSISNMNLHHMGTKVRETIGLNSAGCQVCKNYPDFLLLMSMVKGSDMYRKVKAITYFSYYLFKKSEQEELYNEVYK
jgi:hypothetical protein